MSLTGFVLALTVAVFCCTIGSDDFLASTSDVCTTTGVDDLAGVRGGAPVADVRANTDGGGTPCATNFPSLSVILNFPSTIVHVNSEAGVEVWPVVRRPELA